MRIIFSIVLLSAAAAHSCGSTQETAMVASFNKWISYVKTGDVDKAIELSSTLMKSRWLYRIYETLPFSEFAEGRYRALPKELAKELDDWLLAAGAQYIAYSTLPPIPDKLVASEWFKETIKLHFEQGREIIAKEFRNVDVIRSAVELNEGTVVIRNAEGVTQLYIMRFEEGVWKVDWNKPVPPR